MQEEMVCSCVCSHAALPPRDVTLMWLALGLMTRRSAVVEESETLLAAHSDEVDCREAILWARVKLELHRPRG